jgi:1-acyl-sn-glycerol-3-phosphate acyltransferase
MRKVGGVPANPYNAIRLLEQDELVMAFPEGVKGTGKPYSERYRLARFGRGGFVEVALRTGAPIVPAAVVGSEEIYPKLAENRSLARLLGLPFLPVTPTFPLLGPLGLVPLPSRWRIEFCEPIDLGHRSPDAARTGPWCSRPPSGCGRRFRRCTRTWWSGGPPSSDRSRLAGSAAAA